MKRDVSRWICWLLVCLTWIFVFEGCSSSGDDGAVSFTAGQGGTASGADGLKVEISDDAIDEGIDVTVRINQFSDAEVKLVEFNDADYETLSQAIFVTSEPAGATFEEGKVVITMPCDADKNPMRIIELDDKDDDSWSISDSDVSCDESSGTYSISIAKTGVFALVKPSALRSLELKSVALGGDHTCAIVGRELYCWGYNKNGQLGLGHLDNELTPQKVSLDGVPQAVAPSSATINSYTCAIVKGGDGINKLYCWGSSVRGRLGLENVADNEPTPRLVTLDGEPQVIAAGASHACTITKGSDGINKLYCWGYNLHGQLGLGRTDPDVESTPQLVTLDGEPQTVTAGEFHTCAIVKGSDGVNKPYCWGHNDYAQLGIGDFDNESTPQLVALSDEPQAIVAGRDYVCTITKGSDGANKLYCWGDNAHRQLGSGDDLNYKPTPHAVEFDGEPQMVATGQDHTCAIVKGSDGVNKLYGWGQSFMGKLNMPFFESIAFPRLLEVEGEPQAVALGLAYTCVILKDSDGVNGLKCIGLNRFGQHGYGDTDDRGGTPETVLDALPTVEF